MAVNHADGMFVSGVVLCPVAAVVGAVHGGAGFLSIVFMPVGLGVGIGLFFVGRPPVYAITGVGLKQAKKFSSGWLKQIFFVPFFLLYMILPPVFAGGGALAVLAGSAWVARHLF